MRSIVEIPDPIPYDPQQVPQLIPADPEIEPDTRVPELLNPRHSRVTIPERIKQVRILRFHPCQNKL